MIEEIRLLTEQYHAWLREKTNLRAIEDWVEITAPFLDRHNDYIQIYVKRTKNGYFLTDDGETIDDLELSGCTLDSPKRKALLRTTLNGFGVQLDGNNKALVVRTTAKDFALKKHNLLQAMLAVNDLFFLATPTVASLFSEDVQAWLDDSDISYDPKVKYLGKSGLDCHFDFLIPRSEIHPERFLLSIGNPDHNIVRQSVFAWGDTRETRSDDSLAYAILNDAVKPVAGKVLTAFLEYGLQPVPWSERESVREELAA